MSFDYSAAKAALKAAGHVVSTGPQVLASDIKELVTFGKRNFGLKGSLIRRGIGNPALLPKGFPGVVAPAAKAAPVVAEAPAEDAPKAKKKAAAAQDTPAQETPAKDAPAAGEQAAQ
jgi:hypothetical protein